MTVTAQHVDETVVALAGSICDVNDKIAEMQDRLQFPTALLFRRIGQPMLDRGERWQQIDGYKFICLPPGHIKGYPDRPFFSVERVR